MREALPVRLGGIAANLARVSSFTRNPANEAAVNSLLEESKYFIEWTAAEAEIETAAKLVELQVQMAVWQRNWTTNWSSEERRLQIGQKAKDWSKDVLASSGLL